MDHDDAEQDGPRPAPRDSDIACSAAELRGRAKIIERYTDDAAVLDAHDAAGVLARLLGASEAVDAAVDAVLLDLRRRPDPLTFAELEQITGVADSTLSSRHKAAKRRATRAQHP